MINQILTRNAEFSDYPIISKYDEFMGDRRLDLQRKELIVSDLGNQRAVGYGRLTNASFFDWPLLSILCVKSECRRSGIATSIIREAIKRCEGSRLYTSTEIDNKLMLAVMQKIQCEQIGYIDKLNLDDKREIIFRLL